MTAIIDKSKQDVDKLTRENVILKSRLAEIEDKVFPNGKSSIPIDFSKSDVFICSPPSKDVQSAISSEDTYVQGNGSSPSGDLQPVVPPEVSCNTLPSDLHLVDSNNGSPPTDGIPIRITNRHPSNPQLVDSNKANPSIDASQNHLNPYQSESQIAIQPVSKRRPSLDTRGIQSISRFSMLIEPTNIIEGLLLKIL